jgi:hypothetical protein
MCLGEPSVSLLEPSELTWLKVVVDHTHMLKARLEVALNHCNHQLNKERLR